MVKDVDLKPIHPGEILKSEFLEPLNMKGEELAQNLRVEKRVIQDLLAEKSSMTVDLAYRLYFYFGVSAEYWLNFQKNYDLETYQELAEKEIRGQIQPYPRKEQDQKNYHQHYKLNYNNMTRKCGFFKFLLVYNPLLLYNYCSNYLKLRTDKQLSL